MTKRIRIIIDFPVLVDVSNDVENGIIDLIQEHVCEKYKLEHPDRTMWVFGYGDMMTCNPLMLSDDEPIPFDSNVFHIECAERERYDD